MLDPQQTYILGETAMTTSFHRQQKSIHNFKLVGTLLTAMICITGAQPSFAARILVKFDDNAGGKHNNAGGLGSVGIANFGDLAPFSSRGFQNGSLIRVC